MRDRYRGNRGQVLVLVTFALFAMAGMLGLAVDLGWSYFVKKSAQTAADAAALAAVGKGFQSESDSDGNDTFDCGTEVACTGSNIVQCPVSGSPDNTSPAPTVPNVEVSYWVTARVTQATPQLFSSILGNTLGVTSARSTAAIVNSVVQGSLILINRDNDCVPMDTGGKTLCGVDLLVQANNNQGAPAVDASGGILMSSTKHGVTADGDYSGENQGGGGVVAPFTLIRGLGDITLGGSSTWVQPPTNHVTTPQYFLDPMRNKGQPPAPTGLLPRQILDGKLIGSSNPNAPAQFPPGNYYAVDKNGKATGDPLTVSGYVEFTGAGAGGFGNYVFFGGVKNQSAGTTVTFDPGRYILAGVKQKGQNPGSLFDIQTNMVLQDKTSAVGKNSDAGEIFVFTDATYPGLQVPSALAQVQSQLKFGISGFQTGNNASVYVNIHGLNRTSDVLPPELKTFAPTVLWQDQRNSVVKYTQDGNIDFTSCGPGHDINNPCGTSVNPASTELFFKASPSLHIYGYAYQPRGAFTSMNGGGGYDSPLQLIAGALAVHGNANVKLQEIDEPIYAQIVALIE